MLVTVAALPGQVRPRFRSLGDRFKAVAVRWLSPAKPVLRNLASIPFTVAGWGLISAAAFELNLIVGLAATGIIAMVLEHQIADQ